MHLLVDRARSCIDLNGSLGFDKGTLLPRTVDLISADDLMPDLRFGYLFAPCLCFQKPASHALVGACHKEHLHLGMRKHHRADVTSVHDNSAGFTDLALTFDERLTYRWKSTDLTHDRCDVGLTDGQRDIFAIEHHPLRPLRWLKTDVALLRQGAEVGIGQGTAALQSSQRDRTVHGPGVDVHVAQILGHAPGGGTFSGSGRSVNGDDDAFCRHFGEFTETLSADGGQMTWPPKWLQCLEHFIGRTMNISPMMTHFQNYLSLVIGFLFPASEQDSSSSDTVRRTVSWMTDSLSNVASAVETHVQKLPAPPPTSGAEGILHELLGALPPIVFAITAGILIWKRIDTRRAIELAMIDKGLDPRGGITERDSTRKFRALRFGLLLVGVGLGLCVAMVIWNFFDFQLDEYRPLVALTSVAFFSGLALTVYHIIATSLEKR